MKRTAAFLTVLLAFALLLSACGPAATGAGETPSPVPATATTAPTAIPQPATATAAPTDVPSATLEPTAEAAPAQTFTDALGNTLALSQPPERIVSLAPSNTEILFAVGAGAQVVGRDDFSNFPESAAALPSVGGSMSKYNLEELAKLEPDLVLVSPITPPEQVEAMQAITPNVFMIPNPKSLDELYANLEMVGKMTGHGEEAQALAGGLRERAQAVLEKVKGVEKTPKVFYELDATDPAKPWTAGPGTFIELLIQMAGGENLGSALSGEWAQVSQEDLIVQNPDIILLGDALYGGVTPEQVAARPGWNAIQAVKDGNVFAFNDDLVSRPGPRMIDGLEELARTLHPDLFP